MLKQVTSVKYFRWKTISFTQRMNDTMRGNFILVIINIDKWLYGQSFFLRFNIQLKMHTQIVKCNANC